MNQTTNAKRFLASILCMVLTLATMLPLFVQAAPGDDVKADIILVVDDTGSMQDTDPDKLSAVAIKKFVEKIPSNYIPRLGITTYAIDVESSLDLGQTPQIIKDFADDNINQAGRGTDAAMGIKWAIEQFETNGDPDADAKVIVLIGDGENDYRSNGRVVRTEEESNAVLEEAVQKAVDKGINVYTLAINPTDDAFRQYFQNIADTTGGMAYEPRTAADVDGTMDDIFTTITGAVVQENPPVPLPAGKPVKKTFEVPEGVFEMHLQCDYEHEIEVSFTTPEGDTLNENSKNVTYVKEQTYITCKIQEPMEGEWTVTYRSDVAQTIKPKFIFHTDLVVKLSKNQKEVMQQKPVEYMATVIANGEEITEDKTLKDFKANLVIVKLDEDGKPEETVKEKMTVKKGQLFLEYAIEGYGDYEIYAEIEGDKKTIKSKKLAITVEKNPDVTPMWVIIVIIAGVIILLIVIFILYRKMTTGDGTGIVRGNVSVKIVGRLSNDETMIFPQDRFDCEQIFGKKNTLSDLISAYVKRYRINNSSELAEMSLTQFMNSTLSEVTNKISICGNKKKQTIIRIPVGYEMQIDGMDINKPKVITFNSPEKAIEMRFKNQGCSYTISLIFTRM